MNAPLKTKPKKAEFAWHDPLLLEAQLTEAERMVRDAARAFAQEKLQPRVLEAFRTRRPIPRFSAKWARSDSWDPRFPPNTAAPASTT